MPTPTSETRATSASAATPDAPSSSAWVCDVSTATGEVGVGTVNEMSVVPCADVFCTIMSTLIDLSASARKSRAATPGRSGHPADGDLGLRGVVGHGGDDGFFHVCILLDHPGARLPGEAAAHVQRDIVVAGELDGAQHQDPAPGRRHLEHLVERDPVDPVGLGHDPGVRA